MSYWKPRGYTDKDGTYKRYRSPLPNYIRRDEYSIEQINEEICKRQNERE